LVNIRVFTPVNRCILLGLFGLGTFAAGRPWSPEDLWEWRTASDPQISADARWVVFVERWKDRAGDRTYSSLRLVSADGKNLRALTEGPQQDTSPRWSPDGSRIAYLSARGGTTQIYVRQLETGQETQITHQERGPQALAWSPDGNSIAFTAPVPVKREPPAWAPPAILPRLRQPLESYRQLFVAPAAGGAARQLSTGDFDRHGEPVWMPDGRHILCSWPLVREDPLGGEEIFSIRVSDGQVRRLTDHAARSEHPVPSPDGSKIAYLASDSKAQSHTTTKLHVMNADGGRVKVLSGLLDRDARQPQWSSDSRTIYFLADDRGSTHVYAARNDATLRQVTSMPGRLRGFSLADDGRAVSIRSTIQAPAEVVAFTVDVRSEIQKLTSLNETLLAGREIGPVEEIAYPSGVNSIQGWVVKPPGFDASRKYPLLLDILDGPGRMYGAEFNGRAQILAARGFVVLCVNPRGSAGYGEQFGNLLPTRFPGDDYEDLMRGVDFLIAKGYVDERRLLLAGGLVAAWALGHTDRFTATVVRRPVVDWATDIATRPDGARRAALWMRALPWENPEQYLQRSPLFFAQNFRTPALILAGDPDPESDELYFALRMKKVDTALVRFPEVEHPSDAVAELEATLRWMERFTR
jgi:dipeptidyl aminopeptidase/acylaminoacyl peptidase